MSVAKHKAALLCQLVSLARLSLELQRESGEAPSSETVDVMRAALEQLYSRKAFVAAYREQHDSLRALEEARFPGIQKKKGFDIDVGMLLSTVDANAKKQCKQLVHMHFAALRKLIACLGNACPSERSITAPDTCTDAANVVASVPTHPRIWWLTSYIEYPIRSA